MTIAIVGGGLAGATAAGELREAGYSGPIVLYAAEEHLPYERPPLSKAVLMGNEDEDSATVHNQDWYVENDIDLRLGTPVTAIDPGAHTITTAAGGSESYDKLILATGASPRQLDLADASGKPVHYLRTREDSRALRGAFGDGVQVVIIGGGWIGLEVAAAARDAGCKVRVHELADLPLQGVLGPEVAQAFADLHTGHGVDLSLGSQVSADDLADADLIVVGVGAVPQTALAAEAGLAVDNGVLVDAQLRTSEEDIYAIGDLANEDHPSLGRLRVEHWDNAIEQAKAAARNVAGANEEYTRQPYFFTDQYDLGMEYVGYTGPDGYDEVIVDGNTGGDSIQFRAYWVRGGIVVAAMHANDWDASDAIRESLGSPPPGG